MPDQAVEDFYELPGPNYLQQGDIFPAVPLFSLPALNDLVLVREAYDGAPVAGKLEQGVFALVAESTVEDSFLDGATEFIVVTAQRGLAMLVTQTCNVEGAEALAVCPVLSLQGTTIDRGNLFSGRYAGLFGLHPHPEGIFGECYVDLSFIKPVRASYLQVGDRLASLSAVRQLSLMEKLASAHSRDWGHAEGERVTADGQYRCLRCNRWHDVQNPIVELKAGQTFPKCEKCSAIRKSAQWQLLLKYQKY